MTTAEKQAIAKQIFKAWTLGEYHYINCGEASTVHDKIDGLYFCQESALERRKTQLDRPSPRSVVAPGE